MACESERRKKNPHGLRATFAGKVKWHRKKHNRYLPFVWTTRIARIWRFARFIRFFRMTTRKRRDISESSMNPGTIICIPNPILSLSNCPSRLKKHFTRRVNGRTFGKRGQAPEIREKSPPYFRNFPRRSRPLSICSMLVAKLRRMFSSQPKSSPGTQATLASSSSRLQNSTLPLTLSFL
jgi:hypothetical protein